MSDTVVDTPLADRGRPPPARRRLRRPLDQEGGRRGRRAPQPAALPLRVQGRPGAEPVRGGEQPPARPAPDRMYAEDIPLWRRYEQACDFLEDDLDAGYVRVLQEMVAVGWSNQQVGDAVRELLGLVSPARRGRPRGRAEARPAGPFTPDEVATLVFNAFLGSRRCCCSASTAGSCRSARPCAGSGSSSEPSRKPPPHCCWIASLLGILCIRPGTAWPLRCERGPGAPHVSNEQPGTVLAVPRSLTR